MVRTVNDHLRSQKILLQLEIAWLPTQERGRIHIFILSHNLLILEKV